MEKSLFSIFLAGIVFLLTFSLESIPVSASESAAETGNLLYEVNFKDSMWGFIHKDSLTRRSFMTAALLLMGFIRLVPGKCMRYSIRSVIALLALWGMVLRPIL